MDKARTLLLKHTKHNNYLIRRPVWTVSVRLLYSDLWWPHHEQIMCSFARQEALKTQENAINNSVKMCGRAGIVRQAQSLWLAAHFGLL